MLLSYFSFFILSTIMMPIFLSFFILSNNANVLFIVLYPKYSNKTRVSEPACFGAAPGIFYPEPAPGKRVHNFGIYFN